MLIGILIIISSDVFLSFGNNNKKVQTVGSTSVKVSTSSENKVVSSDYEDKIKKELSDTLSLVSGAGKVSIMIYFDGSSEEVPVYSSNDTHDVTQQVDSSGGKSTTDSTTTNHTVVSQGTDNKPYMAKELNPSIGGVLVIAEGAGNSDTKEKLTNAVKTVLNIPQCKVEVLPMKK